MRHYWLGCLILMGLWTAAACARVTPTPESLTPLAKRNLPTVLLQRGHDMLDEHPNHRINSDNSGQIQNEEMAAISPVNDSNFVAVWRDFRLGYRRVGVGYSTNSGTSWNDELFPAMYYPWQSDPLLVVDDSGHFTANLITFDPATGGEDGIIQITSTDGGASWHDSVWAAHATVPLGFEDKQMLTVDTTHSAWRGSFYCIWAHFYGPNPYDSTHIWLTFKRPGEPYSTPRVLSQTQANQWSNVCVGPNGQVYATWLSYWYQAIMFSRSTDGGETWTPQSEAVSTRFVSGQIEPDLTVFAYGVMASDHSGGPHHGRLYVLYTDVTQNMQETDIWLVYSDTHGNQWSPRVRVDDEPTGVVADQFHPWISVDEEGRVWVVYYDRRNDPNNLLMDVYFTVSTDGGQTWRPGERITTVSSDPGAGTLDAGLIGEYIGWHARGGKALAVWTDTRLGNQDAFGALIDSVFTPSTVDDPPALIPSTLSLHSYPNPTNGTAMLSYTTGAAQTVRLRLYNVLGQLVREVDLGRVSAGEHRYALDLADHATGLYIAELAGSTHTVRTKVMLLK